MATLLLILLACHLGRPPGGADSLVLGEVRMASVEGDLRDAVAEGVAGSLARRGQLGSARAVDVVILGASTSAVAASGPLQAYTAHLSLAFVLTGAPGGRLVLSGERCYAIGTTELLGGEAPGAATVARSATFAALAAELTEDAVEWMLTSAAGGSP